MGPKRMQDCPNGKLTPAKFVDMYKMFFPSGNAEEFCDHVFRTFDMDKNGYIDFKNFDTSKRYALRDVAASCRQYEAYDPENLTTFPPEYAVRLPFKVQ
uniref:EF-hand domain-containing protein n=1 Tax=Anopheles minimus TaxID=112268 RepID=A0A182WJQ1_9DIPT